MRFKLLQIFLLVLSSFVGGMTARAFDVEALAISITSVLFPTNANHGTGAMWSGVDARIPQNWNFSDRFFVGNAAFNIPVTRGPNTTYIPNSTAGAAWAVNDAQSNFMATTGNIGLTATSRASDGDAIVPPPLPVGVVSFVIDDSTADRGAAAFYGEVQYQPIGAQTSSNTMELDCKNKTATNSTTDPYLLRSGCSGLALGAGGDPSYGGVSTNPSNTAIFINKNSNTWNQGIVFSNTSLTDGKAISMAQGHQISWYSAFQTISAQLLSGAGSPVGAVNCSGRCLYIRTDGAAGSTLYVNETGGGTSGWAAK
jgi:hypothetical protein